MKYIDDVLSRMFVAQKPFIKCQKGCAYCCKEGEYPISELEYINLMLFFNGLADDIKIQVEDKIKNLLKQERSKLYECPFLVDNVCTVYPARAIICRTFGLISYDDKDKKRIPFCVNMDLNYSEVFDKDKQMIISNAADGTEPVAFNIDRHFLRSKRVEKQFNIFFGDDKALIDWLADEGFN